MKKLFTTVFTAIMVFSLVCVAIAADSEYAHIYELFEYWEENGTPEWVSSVSSTDGTSDRLTVTIVQGYEEKEAQLRSMLQDQSTLTVVTGGAYSEAAMKSVQEEIVANYMGESGKVAGCGVGWTTINGKATGFGESGTESRVVVGVLEEYYDELRAELTEKYGDMVYVESTSGYTTNEDAASIAIIGGADGPTSVFVSGDGSPLWMLILGAVIILAAIIAAVVLTVKCCKKKKQSK